MQRGRNQDQAGSLQSRHYSIWQIIFVIWQSDELRNVLSTPSNNYFTITTKAVNAFIVLMSAKNSRRAFFSVIGILGLTVALVAFDVAFSFWYNSFYSSLQAYDKGGAIRLLCFFFGLAAVYILVAVYRFYITQLFGLSWRRWLTKQFIDRWLSNRGYYLIENFDEHTDNPDQRLQEDVGSLITYSIDLVVGLVSSAVTFFSFIYILWSLSGVLKIPLGSMGTLTIQGYLVWVGVLYAMFGSYCTYRIGRPLVALNFEQQRREATFRYAAVDLRTHTEHVALYRGEEHQGGILKNLFGRVLDNWYVIIMRQKLLLWFTAGYNQTSVVLPLLVALPNYFNKVFLLGGLIQSLQAFGKVQDSLSFIVNSYTSIAQWQAIAQRLTTFLDHLYDAEESAKRGNKLDFKQHAVDSISVNNVSIDTPRHEVLLKNINEMMTHGKNYLIKGESGIGKSTFVRAVAGIWPYAMGEITLPVDKQVMFLPQRPYMPLGTLFEAIAFPDEQDKAMEPQIATILRECNLEHLIPRLHETASWSEQLSPGEQQRIAFTRVFLQKPDWVFLDESTSMLDLASETKMYQLMKSKLPHCSIVSVGHRPSLDAFHDQVIDMEKYSAEQVAV